MNRSHKLHLTDMFSSGEHFVVIFAYAEIEISTVPNKQIKRDLTNLDKLKKKLLLSPNIEQFLNDSKTTQTPGFHLASSANEFEVIVTSIFERIVSSGKMDGYEYYRTPGNEYGVLEIWIDRFN